MFCPICPLHVIYLDCTDPVADSLLLEKTGRNIRPSGESLVGGLYQRMTHQAIAGLVARVVAERATGQASSVAVGMV